MSSRYGQNNVVIQDGRTPSYYSASSSSSRASSSYRSSASSTTTMANPPEYIYDSSYRAGYAGDNYMVTSKTVKGRKGEVTVVHHHTSNKSSDEPRPSYSKPRQKKHH